MKMLPSMVNMARTQEDLREDVGGVPPAQIYPYGLCISLTEKELEKLNLDDECVEVGDMVHLFAMCKVTSVSKNDTESGKRVRVELQITDIATENEDDENEGVDGEEDNVRRPAQVKNPYKY